MSTPDINSFQRTGNPEADLARWEAMGGTKEQLQAAFGDPAKPNSTFTAGQQFPPMPPNGNIWGGQMPMMMPHIAMPMMPMFGPSPFVDFSVTTSSSSTTTSTTTSSKKKSNIAKNYGKTDEQKTHMQEDNYNTYIEKAENTQLTKQERKEIKKQTKAYMKEMSQWRKDYEKEINAERKAAVKEAKKAGKSKEEIQAIYNEYETKLNNVETEVQAKFSEMYPNEDYYAVLYNNDEIWRGSNTGLFGTTPQLIYTTKE